MCVETMWEFNKQTISKHFQKLLMKEHFQMMGKKQM